MSAEFEYDVFLSHNQADKPRVRRLAERLRAAGLRVWFDEWVAPKAEGEWKKGEEELQPLAFSLFLSVGWSRRARWLVPPKL